MKPGPWPDGTWVNPDFADLLRAFSAADAKFLVVGGYAVSFHSQPRTTGDLDVWVEPTPENAARVYRALEEFGAPLHDLTLEDLALPGLVFQMGIVPRRIDILTRIEGVNFDEAWPDRVFGSYGGVSFALIGKAALIRNKRAVGRPRDLIDVASLEKA